MLHDNHLTDLVFQLARRILFFAREGSRKARQMAGTVVFADVGLRLERLADGGPWYAETRLDRTIAEPWNAVTAAWFLLLVVVWLVRLRGRFRRFPFLTCCLPILAAGGIGGTLYHAFRISSAFFWMDVLPIYLLGLATSGLHRCARQSLSRARQQPPMPWRRRWPRGST